MTEVTIEPTHETMNDSIYFYIQFEAAVEVQLLNGYLLEVDIVKLETVSKDVLMINGVHDRLRKNPLLHAFHTDPINVVPKVLNRPMITSFFL